MSATGPLLIGVDVGTTRIKAGVIDLDGSELAHTSQPTVWTPRQTGAEARPADFSASVERALAALLPAAPAGVIAGVGITSMAETAALIGPGGEALGPAIAWYDNRAQADMAEMEAALTRETIGHVTGLDAKPIPTVVALRFLMRTEPDLRRATRVLSVAEWIAYRLTGTAASERSLASRTGALAILAGRWWPDVIEWAGLSPALFAELLPAGSSWGRIEAPPPGLERLRGAAVTVAGHDHLVAAIGSGITGSSQVMDSCGTAEAVMRAVPADAPHDPADGLASAIATGWHALPGFHCLLAGLPLGIELTPLLEQLGATHSSGLTSLDAGALATLDSGRSSDQPDTPAAKWLRAVRGTVDRAAAARRELERLGPGPIEEMRLSGGWASNPVLRRLKDAESPQLPVYPHVTEAGVRGAGLMAGIAAGTFASVDRFPAPATSTGPQQPATAGTAPPHQLQT